MNCVELSDVTKNFGSTTAVANLSLAVPVGSVYGFIGPNGSGKTTTLRMITNILSPDRGTIRVFGEALRGSRSNRLGYLPEERGLYRRMKVRPFLRFYGELKAGRRVDADVERWIERLQLSEHADKRIEALSKGTSQRVQFLAAVVAEPELVILDEPFSGLDPIHAELLRKVILDLRHSGKTVILSTHDMRVAETMCDFIFMIFRGCKVLDGTLADIKNRYGADTLRFRTGSGEASRLAGLKGVESVRDLGRVQELRLTPGADPQEILRQALAIDTVHSFEIAQPSLHDIFVGIAGASPRGDVQDA
ncbi:MAG: ATP-binding cassette domain-containing protein [Verrucomicrobiales bacterium]|nr:ATP-binding cassette domain-containing protein [Verrucomicrobiales bacterium]